MPDSRGDRSQRSQRSERGQRSSRRSFARFVRELPTDDLRKLVDHDAQRAWSVLMRDREPTPERLKGPRRWFRQARLLYDSVAEKLTPGRRLLFAVGIVCAILGPLGLDFSVNEGGTHVGIDASPFFFSVAIACLLYLLVLELVDRVLVRDELELARDLQRDLLPEEDPVLDGYAFAHLTRMANDIGGDYYRFQRLDDGRFVVLVADASGHGMAAGLLMAMADATLSVAIDVDPSPLAVADRLHRALRRTRDRRSFLTLFYGLLDPATGTIDFVSAGHPPPLVRRASGEIDELRHGSFPLGLRERLDPVTGSIRLEPGDLLLLFTDGLFEALGPGGDAFGYERLRAALTGDATPAKGAGAAAVHRAVLAAFERHAAGAKLADDLTLLAVERRDLR